MHNLQRTRRATTLLACSAGLIAVSACDNDRSAEAETPVSEAEVSTELPESVISDNQLEATANVAAEIAATPPPRVVPVPVQQGASAMPANPGPRPMTNTQSTPATNTSQ